MSTLPSTVLRSPDVLREILHFVRNGADFLRCELVCVAWRGVVDEDALWQPRPIGYGDNVLQETSVAGRRGCLEAVAIRAIRHLQRGLPEPEGDFKSVLGPVKMRRIVEFLYGRCGYSNVDPRPRFTDGAVAALCDVVEQWMGGIMEGCLLCMMHRSHTGHGDDDLSPPLLSETGSTVGARDFFFYLQTLQHASGAQAATFLSIENWLDEVLPFSSQYGSRYDRTVEKMKQEPFRKSLLGELVNDCSNSELACIVRRIARRASVVGITGAAMELASCYCFGAIGALLKIMYLLHPEFSHSELPPSDDDDYSSADETLDDEDPTPRFLEEHWAHVHSVRTVDYPPKSAAPFTVTSATVAYAAESLRIVDRYYPTRFDDEDSDSSSDEDSGSTSGSSAPTSYQAFIANHA